MATLLDAPVATDRDASVGDSVLATRRLTKQFGKIKAVDSLDLTVRRGEVLGFLGPNGSGKSTTISMVLGLVLPTEGSVSIMGQSLAENPELVSRHVGAIIENPAFYPYLTGRDNLRAQAKLVGGVPEGRIDELIKLVNMEGRADGKYKTFSLGMKQRIGIASTLLTNPELVILDEPTNGLDPAGQREIRALIPRLASEGRAVLLASHLLHEVEQVSDRVAIIRKGRLLREGTIAGMVRGGNFLDVEVADPLRAADVLRSLPFVDEVVVNGRRLQVVAAAECSPDVNRALAAEGLYAAEIVRRRSTLEDVFLELTGMPDGEEPGEAATGRTERDARHVA